MNKKILLYIGIVAILSITSATLKNIREKIIKIKHQKS